MGGHCEDVDFGAMKKACLSCLWWTFWGGVRTAKGGREAYREAREDGNLLQRGELRQASCSWGRREYRGSIAFAVWSE